MQTLAPQRRDRMHIIADLVGITVNGKGKARIMRGANLSFAQVNEYLPYLLELKLVVAKTTNGRTVYSATSKGTRFLSTYTEIRGLLKTEGRRGAEDNSVVYAKNGNFYKTKE